MNKKLLLGVLFVVLINNPKALEIRDNFINNESIIFENIEHKKEMNVVVIGDNIAVTNNGIILSNLDNNLEGDTSFRAGMISLKAGNRLSREIKLNSGIVVGKATQK